MKPRRYELCTAGYQGEKVDAFIEKLVREEVTLLVDVRRRAISRKPGFSKTALRRWLEDAGIEYVHFQHLGLPEDLMHLRNPRDNTPVLKEYRARLSTSVESLRALRDLAVDHRVCLLCVEADHSQCHRAILASLLESEWECEVCHL